MHSSFLQSSLFLASLTSGGGGADGTIIYDESFSNVAISTIPTITGMTGDTKDYTVLTFTESTSDDQDMIMYFNADTTDANYTENAIRSASGTTTGAYSTSSPEVASLGFAAIVGLTKHTITGSSGERRLIKSSAASILSTSAVDVTTSHVQWENTANEITSLQITGPNDAALFSGRIVVYEHGKIGDDTIGNLELVGTESWAAASDTKSFTGLDGDTDGFYRFFHTTTGNTELKSNINSTDGDSGRLWISNASGTLSTLSDTSDIPMLFLSSDVTLSAKTGFDRPMMGDVSNVTNNSFLYNSYNYLTNTATNITNLDFDPAGTVTGDVSLYRSTDGMFDTLPFELVETKNLVSVTSSSASPVTFSNLTGDSEFLYKLTFSITSSVTSTLNMRINNDTTAGIYKYTIRKNITSAFASAAQVEVGRVLSGETCLVDVYIHPNKGSGVERPFTIRGVNDQDEMQVIGGMWNNTASEITSLEIYPSTSGNVTGTVTLSKLRIV